MDDLRSIITKNEKKLPQEQVDKLLKVLSTKSATYLSPEKEAGAFLFFCLGKSTEEISALLSFPKEVILLTYFQYKWEDKAALLKKSDGGLKTIGDLQKDLTSSLLVATLLAAQKQIGDFIAGRISAKDCKWLPNNMQSLEKLMNMINSLNPAPAPATNVITATNVQVNNTLPPGSNIKLDQESKIKLLKKISDGKQQ